MNFDRVTVDCRRTLLFGATVANGPKSYYFVATGLGSCLQICLFGLIKSANRRMYSCTDSEGRLASPNGQHHQPLPLVRTED